MSQPRPALGISFSRWIVAAACCAALSFASAQADDPAKLRGTFIQLTAEHGLWPREKWRTLFDDFRQLGLEHIVVQWVAYDDLVFFDSSAYSTVTHPPLETILQLADESDMRVLVGLAHDSQFWQKIDRRPNLVEVYFGRRIAAARALLAELAPRVQQHAAFEGWYIADEIDDVNWQTDERRQILVAYLRNLTDHLHRITPQRPVALSGFSNAKMSPASFAGLWDDLLGAAAIDMLLFQDGIGAQKLTLSELRIYLNALQPVIRSKQRQLRVVVELFQQDTAPINDVPFRAFPAPLERIRHQLALAAEYTAYPIAFSVPDYMNPQDGTDQETLFRAYLNDITP